MTKKDRGSMPQEPTHAQLRDMIDKAFSGPVKRVGVSKRYRRGLLIAAIGTLLLPLLYCLLIASLGYGMYRYNQGLRSYFQARAPIDFRNWRPGQGPPPRVNLDNQIWIPARIRWILFIPLVIGIAVEIFLLRPFLPTWKRRSRPLYEITSETEPVFYYFIERLCQSIGIRMPRRIELTMEPKISAGFRRGIFSFLGSDLTLTIGLPLISNLTACQLSGLLAHEMGHFRQGVGMRLSYLISCVINWFDRNIHDEKLDREDTSDWDVGDSYYGRITWRQGYMMFLLLIRLFILLTRGILWLYLAAGYLINRSITRQMEYDADLYQIRVAGTRDFESVIYLLNVIETAYRRVYRMNEKSWDHGVGVNDLPALTRTVAEDVLNQNRREIVDSILETDTQTLDAYPCPRDRIAQARRENTPGICRMELKPKMLFSDYPLLCRRLTREFFEREFKAGTVEKRLISVEQFEEFMLDMKLRRR